MTDADGWTAPQYYKTIRVVSIGHFIYVVGRGATGISLHRFNTTNNEWHDHPTVDFMTDARGWNVPEYYSTFHAVVVHDRIYLCGRGAAEVHIAFFESRDRAWQILPGHLSFSDASGFNQPQYYRTFRVVAHGQFVFCLVRGSIGIHLLSFDTYSGQWLARPTLPMMSDASGWNLEQYFDTIRLLPTQHSLLLLGRGATEIHVATFGVAANSWFKLPSFGSLTDAEGWFAPEYFRSIRAVTTDSGRVVHLIGRGRHGIYRVVVQVSTGAVSIRAPLPVLQDAGGWANPSYHTTIQLADWGHFLLLVARGSQYIHVLPMLALWDASSS
eukprot:m.622634 g.622634  ORF g.622634 m.622634 type:complete len:327 (-) comp58219_c1_seq8:1048-2028(-)